MKNEAQLKDLSLRIYFVGLLLLGIGLPLGNFPISLSQFILAGAWILYPDYKEKFKNISSNKPALVLMSVYFLHVIGLLYTNEDFSYAMKDLRIKLPILILPFIIGSMPKINNNQFQLIVKFFVASLVFTSLVCTAVRLGIYPYEVNNIRDISIYISHIRYSLLLCIGIFFCLYKVYRSDSTMNEKIWFLLSGLWLIAFLFILQSPTGVGMFLIGTLISASILILRSKRFVLKTMMILLIISIPLIALQQFHSAYEELLVDVPVDKDQLEEFTVYGNKYVHYTDNNETENGNRTWIYISWEELEDVWSKRSEINFSGNDKSGNQIKYTLIRYLTSKGLRKDAEGLSSLGDKDIKKIERGIANANREGLGSFSYRIYQLVWEYRSYVNGGNPSGHSMPMRIEYWKAASGIIASAPIFGVGTGDLPEAFNKYYEENNSLLGEKWRRRAHNQYLSMTAAFGIIGFIWFMFSLFFPGIKLGRFSDYYYFIFFAIITISMLTEDTIESQVGVSIFAYFNSLLLFRETSEESI